MKMTKIQTGGWVCVGLAGAALLASAAGKLFAPPQVKEQLVDGLGFPETTLLSLAITEIVCVLLVLVPRTSLVGGILVASYVGGAVAAHVRVGEPFIVPVVLGVLMWIGLVLRDPLIRAVLIRRPNGNTPADADTA